MSDAMAEPMVVLHVDDDQNLLDLAATVLERESVQLRVRTATSAEDALDVIADGNVECVVSDYRLPETDGLTFMKAVREDRPRLPFVLFTGEGSEEIASEAISAGVTDYLRKGAGTDRYALLANRIENLVRHARTEAALREREAHYRSVVEGSHDAVFIHRDDRLVFVNDLACELTGYDEDELRRMSVWTLLHPDDRDRIRGTVARRERGEHETSTFRARYSTKDGDVRHGEFAVRHTTYDGEPATIGSMRDVTEHRRVKEERDEILARMTDAFLALDDEWRFTYLNRRAAELFDRTAHEVLGEVIREELPEMVGTTLFERFREAMATQEPVTVEAYYEPLDGWFEAHAYPSEDGLSVYLRDVTERKDRERTLEALHDATRRLMGAETGTEVSEIAVTTARDVLDMPVTGIWFRDGTDASFRLVARTEEHRTERRNSLDVADRSAAVDAFESGEVVVRRDASGDVPECEALVPLGERGVMSFGGETMDDLGVYHARLLAANTAAALDRAEREDELKANQRELERQNERLEEFASVVSHDLRNPLNVAQGYLDMYLASGDEDHIDRIVRAHERMDGIIEDVLTLAKQGQTVSETESVVGSEVVTLAWASVETGEARLRTEWEAVVDADASRLQQLFENLFHNAVEHAGPAVTVRVDELGDGFAVEDDGPGVPEDVRETAFESGYSTAESGTGFGLTIVEGIAEAHGWHVSLTEGSEGGARFEFTGVEPTEG